MTQFRTIASLVVMVFAYLLEKTGVPGMDTEQTAAMVDAVAQFIFFGAFILGIIFKLLGNRRENAANAKVDVLTEKVEVAKEKIAEVKQEVVEAKIDTVVAKQGVAVAKQGMVFPDDLKPFTGNLGDMLAGFDRFAVWAKARGINEDELDDFREQLLSELKQGSGSSV